MTKYDIIQTLKNYWIWIAIGIVILFGVTLVMCGDDSVVTIDDPKPIQKIEESIKVTITDINTTNDLVIKKEEEKIKHSNDFEDKLDEILGDNNESIENILERFKTHNR